MAAADKNRSALVSLPGFSVPSAGYLPISIYGI
jgi:hypothetical protein